MTKFYAQRQRKLVGKHLAKNRKRKGIEKVQIQVEIKIICGDQEKRTNYSK